MAMITTSNNRTGGGYQLNDDTTIVDRRLPQPPIYKPLVTPITVTSAPSSCQCQSGSGFEQKIKENPMLFIIGALAIGYFLAKK